MPIRGGTQRYVSGPIVTGTNTTADTSLFFADNQMPVSGAAVRELIFTLSNDATAIVSNVTRVTLRAGQVPFVDARLDALTAMYGFYGKKAEYSGSGVGFSVLLHGYRGWSAPPGQGLRADIAKNATMTNSPKLQIHEGLNDTDMSTGFMYFVGASANIAASAITQPLNITTPGMLVGFVLPQPQNVTLIRIYGAEGLQLEITAGTALIESQQQYRGTTVTDPLYVKLPKELLVTPGASRMEISTNGSWTGATIEVTFHTYVPNPAYLAALAAARKK
jgi:hypothetical protein